MPHLKKNSLAKPYKYSQGSRLLIEKSMWIFCTIYFILFTVRKGYHESATRRFGRMAWNGRFGINATYDR